MNIKIAICEDDKAQSQYLKTLLLKWSKLKITEVSVLEFESAEAFKFIWSEDKSFEILLLDIQMEGQNGIELAKELRKSDESLIIIFITAVPDFIQEGYDVSALHYLIKPIKEDKLFEALSRAVKNIKKPKKTLLINMDGIKERIFLDDIICIEAVGHYISVLTVNGQLNVQKSISQIENELRSEAYGIFHRCHRSYIVNLKFIRRINKSDIILDNGMAVPISRRLYNELNQLFIRYHKGAEQ